MEEERACPSCGDAITGIAWNGKCWDCHNDSGRWRWPSDGGDPGPLPPPGFDPAYAGERWDDDY